MSWAITDKFNGVTFDWTKEGSCKNAIDAMLSDMAYGSVPEIQNWAHRSLSGEAGAAYYLEIVDSVYNRKDMPTPPWVANKR